MGVVTRPESTAVALHDPMRSTLGQMIEPYRAQLTPFLKDGLTLERVAAELVLASRKTPNLDKCAPEVLVSAICTALGTGGMIGRDVHLVPFKDKNGVFEPTVMLDYKFKAELVVAAGGARAIDSHVVWSDDDFVPSLGTEPSIRHRPAIKPDPRREMIGAYAVAHQGHRAPPVIKWMPLAEIEAVRAKSKEWGPTKYGKPHIAVCPPWYACKCAVHRVVKLLPKNPKMRALMALVEKEEAAEFDEPLAVVARVDVPEGIAPATGEDLSYEPTNDGTVRKADTDTAWAFNYVLPGSAKAWGGNGGKRLGELESKSGNWSLLRQIIDYAAQRPDDEQLQALGSAATIVLEVRLRETAEAQGSLGLAEPEPKGRNAVAEGR